MRDLFGKNMFSKKSIFSFALAIISTVFLPAFFDINASLYAFSNSILSLFFLVAAYLLFRKVFGESSKRLTVISIIVGFFFAVFVFVGLNITKYDSAGIYSLKNIAVLLSEVPFFAAVTAYIISVISKTEFVAEGSGLGKKAGAKKEFFIAWLLIFIAWLPYLIAAYPGVYSRDSIYQMAYYQSGKINLHHPLIHTYLFGFLVDTVGKGLFGSYETGMCIYSVVQMLCMSAAFAYAFVYMRKRRISPVLSYIFLAVFMFLPTNAVMAITATKDVLYSALFILMIAGVCKIAETPEILKNTGFVICFSAVSFGQIIFRSQGIYIYVFTAIVLLIAFRRYWKPIILSAVAVIIVFAAYSGPVSSALHAVKTEGKSIQEMMSVPCVQLARAALANTEELSEEELELIKKYVPDYKKYYPYSAISDSLKGTFNSAEFKKKPFEFLKLWVSVGVKCPQAYTDAWARLSVGLWYPDMNYCDPAAYHPYWEYENVTEYWADRGYVAIERKTPAFMQWLDDFCTKLTYNNSYNKIPVFSLFFSSGLPFWLLIIYGAYFIYLKKYRYLVPALVIFALWGTMLLGPVVFYRYLYPMIVSIPIMFATLAAGKRKD